MNGSFGRSIRGMQVHAVPEHERGYERDGKRLPWGYLGATSLGLEAENDRGRDQMEKGPFGRSMRRSRGGTSRSRSKTAEPTKEGDRLRAEQLAAEDAIFGNLVRNAKNDSKREALGEVDGNAAPPATQAIPAMEGEKEPTEVLLYGFGDDLQWAAIDFYERVSDGVILEDYDRAPAAQRGLDMSRSFGRRSAQRSLGKSALRKKNRYAGGHHWIKITFDSREAAELACAISPHIIRGHLVYAEPYQGRGPGRDEAILASQAGVQVTSDALPPTFSTNNISPNASTTITSATIGAPASGTLQNSPNSSNTLMADSVQGHALVQQHTTLTRTTQQEPVRRRAPRLEGAIPATIYSAEQALMPKQPKQSWFASFGAKELVGSTVPTTDDGNFDWATASLYWCLLFWLDSFLGTNMCGLRGGE